MKLAFDKGKMRPSLKNNFINGQNGDFPVYSNDIVNQIPSKMNEYPSYFKRNDGYVRNMADVIRFINVQRANPSPLPESESLPEIIIK